MSITGAFRPGSESLKNTYEDPTIPSRQARAMLGRVDRKKKLKNQLDVEGYEPTFRHGMLVKGKYAGRPYEGS